MGLRSFSKAQKREVRRLAGLAHERELAAAVDNLRAQFERWRAGEFDVFELNERIHQFHDGILTFHQCHSEVRIFCWYQLFSNRD